MKRFNLEISVGFFLLLGILCLAYISINLGQMELFGVKGYRISAVFDKIGGVKSGSVVEIAGVKVGTVDDIGLDGYQAKLVLKIDKGIKIQEDSIASIKTKGLIGEKYVQIAPGGSDKFVEPGGKIRETESAIDIEELISKYAFGGV